MRKQLISFAQVIKFCKISSSRGGGFTPKPRPCVRPWLLHTIQDFRKQEHCNYPILNIICLVWTYKM